VARRLLQTNAGSIAASRCGSAHIEFATVGADDSASVSVEIPEVEFNARTTGGADRHEASSMGETLEGGFECDSADRIEDDVRTGAARRLAHGVGEVLVAWHEAVDGAFGGRIRRRLLHVDTDDQGAPAHADDRHDFTRLTATISPGCSAAYSMPPSQATTEVTPTLPASAALRRAGLGVKADTGTTSDSA
jgi:hypothetical protein